jgi:vancomycin resistance protein YoaR
MQYERQLKQTRVPLRIRDQHREISLEALGVAVNRYHTTAKILRSTWPAILGGERLMVPALTLTVPQLHATLDQEFKDVLQVPRNASLTIAPGHRVNLVPSVAGESIDTNQLMVHLQERIISRTTSHPLALAIRMTKADIENNEVEAARQRAIHLLVAGFTVRVAEHEEKLNASMLREHLEFTEQADPYNPGNLILGVTVNEESMGEYLNSHIAPVIEQTPRPARFSLVNGHVEQFALPQAGRQLAIEESLKRMASAINSGETAVELAVATQQPDNTDLANIQELGLTTLLATGESNFAGSPKNRIHNIQTGTARYHGVLIPPQAEFSFNELLGPVNAAAGFKPELVIKHNATVPEFGGGLCQVSTTIFRAAINAGLGITQRRNHAYVVRYYGTPGFDATIYPPSTDLKFMNDTNHHILIQSKLEGTHLTIELWGTPDGRTVAVKGPMTYDKKPDGSVKAVLKRTVTDAQGNEMHQDSFYSRYRSPNLFPKTALR